jgi:hypothetical protein
MPIPATSELPHPTDWNEFEDLCADLFGRIWNDRHTYRYGRNGQRQNGVDIRGQPSDRANAGVQCKGRRQWPPVKLTTAEIDEQVREALKFSPPLTEFIIATTARNDNAIQDHAAAITERHRQAGLFSVHVYAWDELSRRIKDYDPLLEKYNFTTLSSVRRDLTGIPEQTARLVTENLKELGLVSTPPPSPGTSAIANRPDALSSSLAEALERDFGARYRRAMQRSVFPEFAKKDEFLNLAQAVLEIPEGGLSSALRRRILLRATRSRALRDDLQTSETFFAAARRAQGPDSDLPARARIAEGRGNVDEAIRILRDHKSPEARSVLLSVLAKHRSDDNAVAWLVDENISARELTALGVVTLCQIHLRKKNFEGAKQILINLPDDLTAENPYFFLLRASVRFATVLPTPEQAVALSGLPLDVRFARPIPPDTQLTFELDSSIADLHRFLPAAAELELDDAQRIARAYLTWCSLLHPHRRQAALEQLRSDMQEPSRALSLLPFAFAYDADTFDATPIAQHLEKRDALGGLDTEELRAALILRLHAGEPRTMLQLIGKYRPQFVEGFGKTGIASIEIHALALAGDVASAKALYEANKEALGDDAIRLEAEIAKAEGADPVEECIRVYETTRTPESLRTLVGALIEKQDSRTIGPYAEELFTLTNDPRDITLAARAYANAGDSNNFMRVAEAHPVVKDRDPVLAAHYAWRLFHRGQLKEAKAAAEDLARRFPDLRDLNLEIAIAIETGEWEMLAGPLAAFLENAAKHSGPALIRAAHLAQASGHGSLLDLIDAALRKGGNDPDVLLGAYTLVMEEGLEEVRPDAHDWFRRALDLSGPDGPVRQYELKELLAQNLDWSEHTRKVNDAVVRGNIPLAIAAPGLRTSHVDVVLRNFVRNTALIDARKRAVIPIFTGRRTPARIGEVKRIAFDVSSLMVLGWLGLLPKVFEAFPEIVLASGTFLDLFEGRRRLRQFQKSRLARAGQIQNVIARNRLKVLRTSPNLKDPLIKEIGTELTVLIRAAEASGGFVARPAPVHRLGLEEQRDADMSPYAACLTDMHSLLVVLKNHGAIDQVAEETARRYLDLQDKRWPSAPHPDPEHTLYLDGLSLIYLQTLGLTEAVLDTFSNVFIHTETEEEAATLIEYDRHVGDVLHVIDDIRHAVRKAYTESKITFGPRRSQANGEQEGPEAPTLHLLSDLLGAEVVVFDDRALNKEPFAADQSGYRARSATSLDLIEELNARSMITDAERRALRHRLRLAGAALIPLDANEIELAASRNVYNQSQEFRAIRDNIDLVRARDVPRFPSEIPWFLSINRATKEAIVEIWKNESDKEKAAAIADAIFGLRPLAEDWAAQWDGQPPPGWITAVNRVMTSSLALPFQLTGNRQAISAYNDWLERRVFAPMRASAPETYKLVVEYLRKFILETWEDNEKE